MWIFGAKPNPAPPVQWLLAVLVFAFLTVSTSGHADVRDGFTAYNKGDFVAAREVWLPLAQNGDAEAQYNLGVMFARGEALAKSDGEAVKWWRRAAGLGHAASMHNLGFMNATGRGVAADFEKAYVWYGLAAELQPPGPLQDGSRAAMGVIGKKLRQADLVRLDAEIDRRLAQLKTAAAAAKVPPPPPTDTVNKAPMPAPKGPATLSSSGTGFVVSPSGHVLTNAHVIAGCRDVRVRGIGPATVRHADKINDLALLQTAGAFQHWAKFRSGRAIRPGDGVVVAGYPLPGLLASDLNITVGNTSALAGPGNDRRFLQITAPVQLGNSGGPLLDLSGHVVGIVVGKLDAVGLAKLKGAVPENVNFAINASVARPFLDALAVRYETAPSEHQLDAADVGEMALAFTLAVECWR